MFGLTEKIKNKYYLIIHTWHMPSNVSVSNLKIIMRIMSWVNLCYYTIGTIMCTRSKFKMIFTNHRPQQYEPEADHIILHETCLSA